MPCELKKGIFVLHTCNAKSFVNCGVCRRSVCPKHIDKSSSSQIICVECAATSYQQTLKSQPTMLRTTSVLDNFWYYNTRNTFYSTHSHYRPFTSQEQREFDKPFESIENGDLNEEASSFLDS